MQLFWSYSLKIIFNMKDYSKINALHFETDSSLKAPRVSILHTDSIMVTVGILV